MAATFEKLMNGADGGLALLQQLQSPRMHHKHLFQITCGLTALVSVTALAQPAPDKAAMKAVEASLAARLASHVNSDQGVNDKKCLPEDAEKSEPCQDLPKSEWVTISASVDWASLGGQLTEARYAIVGDNCVGAVMALYALHSDERTMTTRARARVRHVRCRFDAAATKGKTKLYGVDTKVLPRAGIGLDKGILTVGFNWQYGEEQYLSGITKDWLGETLKPLDVSGYKLDPEEERQLAGGDPADQLRTQNPQLSPSDVAKYCPKYVIGSPKNCVLCKSLTAKQVRELQLAHCASGAGQGLKPGDAIKSKRMPGNRQPAPMLWYPSDYAKRYNNTVCGGEYDRATRTTTPKGVQYCIPNTNKCRCYLNP